MPGAFDAVAQLPAGVSLADVRRALQDELTDLVETRLKP